MKNLVALFALLALFLAPPLLAQDNPTPPSDQAPTAPTAPSEPVKVKHTFPTPKFEISGGFTHRSYYAISGMSNGMNGGFASFDYNRYRWLGLEGEVLGVTGATHPADAPPDGVRIFTAMIGPKIYPLRHHTLTPFGHVLFGAGISLLSVPFFSGAAGNTLESTVTAWELGGGLDLNRWSHFGVRLIQVDYVNAKFLGPNVPRQGSPRVSFGFVYRFGQR